MLPGIAGAQQAQFDPRSPMLQAVNALNMRSGLRFILDAGDSASYDGSSQFVTDVSGAGATIRLGNSASAEASDMLWTGVAGRNSASEYFYPGASGGYLSLPYSSNTWNDTLHNNNAVWAVAGWQYYIPSVSTGGGLIVATAADYTEVGFNLGMATVASGQSDKMVVWFANGGGSGPGAATVYSSGTVPTNQWSFFALIVNEAAGTYTMLINGSVTTGALSFSSPASGGATRNMDYLLGHENARLANSLMWEATIPTQQQLLNLYNLTRPKFGV